MKLAIIGTRGIPCRYGGFETFAEKLSLGLVQKGHEVTVYCSPRYISRRSKSHVNIRRIFIPSIPLKSLEKISHAMFSVLHNLFEDDDIILMLGVSPVLFSWLLRLFGKKIVINIDGLEWKRKKWSKIASLYLRLSEKLAGKLCHEVVTDSLEIQKYYNKKYGKEAVYIAYGAEYVNDSDEDVIKRYMLKKNRYILQVCRLEPENNSHLVIKEFLKIKSDLELVVLGDNPYDAKYLKYLRSFKNPKIRFLGAIYGHEYKSILRNAYCYVHGHEVGGTNPALLEALAAGKCALVLDVPYNLEVIRDAGISFSKREGDLAEKLNKLIKNPTILEEYEGKALTRIEEAYTWDKIIKEYESLFLRILDNH